MSKFKINTKPSVKAEHPSNIEEFGASAAMAKSQSGGRPVKPIRLNLDIEPELHRRLKLKAIDAGIPVAVLVREWIEAGLAT